MTCIYAAVVLILNPDIGSFEFFKNGILLNKKTAFAGNIPPKKQACFAFCQNIQEIIFWVFFSLWNRLGCFFQLKRTVMITRFCTITTYFRSQKCSQVAFQVGFKLATNGVCFMGAQVYVTCYRIVILNNITGLKIALGFYLKNH